MGLMGSKHGKASFRGREDGEEKGVQGPGWGLLARDTGSSLCSCVCGFHTKGCLVVQRGCWGSSHHISFPGGRRMGRRERHQRVSPD